MVPLDNNLPNSFHIMKKMFTKNSIKEFTLCHICKKQMLHNKCPSDSCLSNSYSRNINSKKSIKVVSADVSSQIHLVITANHDIFINI